MTFSNSSPNLGMQKGKTLSSALRGTISLKLPGICSEDGAFWINGPTLLGRYYRDRETNYQGPSLGHAVSYVLKLFE